MMDMAHRLTAGEAATACTLAAETGVGLSGFAPFRLPDMTGEPVPTLDALAAVWLLRVEDAVPPTTQLEANRLWFDRLGPDLGLSRMYERGFGAGFNENGPHAYHGDAEDADPEYAVGFFDGMRALAACRQAGLAVETNRRPGPTYPATA